MTELIRPALYKAYHQVVPLKIETYEHETVDVVGPVCETSDFIALNRMMPKLKQGNYLAIMTAGAYGFVSSSNYNMRPKPAEVLVNADKVRIIREREDLHLI
jgi:diaminopimelate decarboxylase